MPTPPAWAAISLSVAGHAAAWGRAAVQLHAAAQQVPPPGSCRAAVSDDGGSNEVVALAHDGHAVVADGA